MKRIYLKIASSRSTLKLFYLQKFSNHTIVQFLWLSLSFTSTGLRDFSSQKKIASWLISTSPASPYSSTFLKWLAGFIFQIHSPITLLCKTHTHSWECGFLLFVLFTAVFQHLEQGLAYSRCSINIGWINKS